MKNIRRRIVTVVAVLLLFAVFAWVGGYNFDHREGAVAALFATAVLFAIAAAGYP